MISCSDVLIVDDDPGMLAVASEELQSHGHRVVEAGSGREALEALAVGKFDLVISDLEMPVMNGLELVRHIRALRDDRISQTPIVMLTGREDNNAIHAAFECGASSFVQKPVNWLNFMHHIHFIVRAGMTEAALRESHKVAAAAASARKDLMINLQHELRSPLHVISGYADVIALQKDELSPDLNDAVGFMRSSALDINARLSKIFLLSDLIGGDAKLHKVTLFLREMFIDVRQGLRNGQEMDVTQVDVGLPDDLSISADQKMFMIAAENIFENALKFGGGKVTINHALDLDGSVLIEIADDGEGFEASGGSDLLKLFTQGDSGLTRESTGLGLGLATAKIIVEMHGGSITLGQSEELGGGLVTLKLPLKPSCCEP